MICSSLMPVPSQVSTSQTVILRPRIQGWPDRFPGSMVMRLWSMVPHVDLTAGRGGVASAEHQDPQHSIGGRVRVGDEAGKLGRADAINPEDGPADFLGEPLGRFVGLVVDMNLEEQVGTEHMR